MKTNSGEVVIGLLIGIAVGVAALWVTSGQQAQTLANATGREISQWEVIKDQPGKSTLTLIGPAAAGAGIGWLLDEVSSDEESSGNQNQVSIQGDGNNVVINRDNAESGIDNSDNSTAGGF